MSSPNAAFSNEFGAVYSDRIAFYRKKGWFGGGSLEELPIRHVTSVRLETTRRPILGGILFLVGLLAFGSMSGEHAMGALLAGVLMVALGIVLIIGWPSVTINTAGNDLQRASGGIWQKSNAEDFVTAVKKALFEKQ